MTTQTVIAGGPYGPLTKSIDVAEVLMLVDLTQETSTVDAWEEEALFRLPQPSRQRRQEIVRSVRRGFLQADNGHFAATPLRSLLTAANLDSRLKRDLVFGQYLRATPLVWVAIRDVVLPHAETAAQPQARPEDGAIAQAELDALLMQRLHQYTEATLSRTRQHITAHLTKFGLLEAQPVPGDRIAKRFLARYYEPDPRAFWFSLAVELAEQGTAARSLDYVIHQSWTRIAYCCKPAYARYVMEEAERAALVSVSFFGSEKQLSLRGSDPAAAVAEAIRYG